MNTHVDKTQESTSQSFANEGIQKKSSSESTSEFVDNSPEAKEAAQLQAMADDSPDAKDAIQLQAAADGSPGGKETTQLQSIADNNPDAKEAVQLQAMADEHGAKEQLPNQNKKNNTGLPDDLKTGIENLSGFSMDDVKVHYNSSKPAELQAHAYAEGTDIYIGPGQEKHLPHEAWHVVQQKQGRVKPTLQMEGGVDVNDNKGLEKEADVMGIQSSVRKDEHSLQMKNKPNKDKIQSNQLRNNNVFSKEKISSKQVIVQRVDREYTDTFYDNEDTNEGVIDINESKETGTHSKKYHGKSVSIKDLKKRLQTGLTPDDNKIKSTQKISAKFKTHKDWVYTYHQALSYLNKYIKWALKEINKLRSNPTFKEDNGEHWKKLGQSKFTGIDDTENPTKNNAKWKLLLNGKPGFSKDKDATILQMNKLSHVQIQVEHSDNIGEGYEGNDSDKVTFYKTDSLAEIKTKLKDYVILDDLDGYATQLKTAIATYSKDSINITIHKQGTISDLKDYKSTLTKFTISTKNITYNTTDKKFQFTPIKEDSVIANPHMPTDGTGGFPNDFKF